MHRQTNELNWDGDVQCTDTSSCNKIFLRLGSNTRGMQTGDHTQNFTIWSLFSRLDYSYPKQLKISYHVFYYTVQDLLESDDPMLPSERCEPTLSTLCRSGRLRPTKKTHIAVQAWKKMYYGCLVTLCKNTVETECARVRCMLLLARWGGCTWSVECVPGL